MLLREGSPYIGLFLFRLVLNWTGKHRRLRRKSLLLSHVVLFRWQGID